MILRAGSYTDVMKNMAPAFGEEHNVEFEYLDLDVANMYEKIALNSKSNQGSYDVLMIDEPWFREFQETGIISNLSELGCELDDDFIQEVTEICVDDNGDVYGVPFYGNVELMLYNVDVLSQYGYDAPPTSWTEVLDLAKKVKADGERTAIWSALRLEKMWSLIFILFCWPTEPTFWMKTISLPLILRLSLIHI